MSKDRPNVVSESYMKTVSPHGKRFKTTKLTLKSGAVATKRELKSRYSKKVTQRGRKYRAD